MMKTEIIYEDKDILVVYKPAGLATQTARIGQLDVVSELKTYLSRKEKAAGTGQSRQPYLGIIHRLDQPVEGLLVFAQNKKAAAALTGQLTADGEEKPLNKHYLAVLCGKPSQKEGELVDYLYKNQENIAVIAENPGQKGAKKAVLQYRILQIKEFLQPLALADIQIHTGRFHQIRTQLAHAGTPLLGDGKYGTQETRAVSEAMGIRNVALCACSLELVHPVTGKLLRFQTKPKGDAFSFFSQT